jgi:hypothetical protein
MFYISKLCYPKMIGVVKKFLIFIEHYNVFDNDVADIATRIPEKLFQQERTFATAKVFPVKKTKMD